MKNKNMNKLVLLILCIIVLSGCTTFTTESLKLHNTKIYQQGYESGFFKGRIYQAIIYTEQLLEDIKSKNKGDTNG